MKRVNDLKWITIVFVAIVGASSGVWIIQLISGVCMAYIGVRLARLQNF